MFGITLIKGLRVKESGVGDVNAERKHGLGRGKMSGDQNTRVMTFCSLNSDRGQGLLQDQWDLVKGEGGALRGRKSAWYLQSCELELKKRPQHTFGAEPTASKNSKSKIIMLRNGTNACGASVLVGKPPVMGALQNSQRGWVDTREDQCVTTFGGYKKIRLKTRKSRSKAQ